MKASVNKKLIAILTPIGAVVLAGIIILIVFLTGGFTKTELNFVGIEGMEQVNIDTDNRMVTANVDSTISIIDAMKLIPSQGANLVLYSDPECTKPVSQMDLKDGENIFYAKISDDKKGADKVWTIKINKAAAENPVVTIKSISLKNATNIYTLNQGFGQGAINVVYSDNSQQEVALTSEMLANFNTSSVGKKSVKITYQSLTLNFDIIVYDPIDNKYIVDIEVDNFKNSYALNCGFLGGTLKLKYNDGTNGFIQVTDAMLSNFATDKLGESTATINYLGYNTSASFNVIQAFEQVNIHQFDALMSEVGALFLTYWYGSDYQHNYDMLELMLTSGEDEEIERIISSLNDALTSIGITNNQLESFLLNLKDNLFPVFDKCFNVNMGKRMRKEGPLSGISIDRDALDSLSAFFSEFMNTFNTNDIINILYSLDLADLDGYYGRENMYGEYRYYSPYDLIESLGLDITFFADINRDMLESYDLENMFSREDLGNQLLSSFSLLKSFVDSNKADYLTAFNMINDMFLGGIDVVDFYDMNEVLHTINFVGDFLKSINSAFASYNAANYVADKVLDDSFYPISYVKSGFGEFAGLLGGMLTDIGLADLEDFLDYQSQEGEYGAAAKQAIIIGKLFYNNWEKLSQRQKADICLYLNSVMDAPTENIAEKIVEFFSLTATYYIDDLSQLSDEDIDTLDEEISNLANLLYDDEPIEDRYIYVDCEYDIIVRKGASYEDMFNLVLERVEASYGVDGTSYEIDLFDSIQGLDSSKLGLNYFSIFSNGLSAQVPYYVVDETTKIKYTEYEAFANSVYVELNSEIIEIDYIDSYISYSYTELGCSGSFGIDRGNFQVEVADLFKVNTGTAGKYTGFYVVKDISLGTVYVPFTYYVYDLDNLDILFISYIDINDCVKGNDIEGYINAWNTNGEIEAIEITNSMVSNFDKNKLGAQTITITYDEFVEYVDVFVLETSEDKIVTQISAYLPSYIIYKVGDEINKEDVQVALTYNNDRTDSWSVGKEDFEITYNPLAEGYCQVTVTAFDLETKFMVKVISESYANTITNIEFRAEMDIESYCLVGAAGIDLEYYDEDTTLIVTYGDGYDVKYYNYDEFRQLVEDEIFVINFDSSTPGTKKLTFEYDGVKLKQSYFYTVYSLDSVTEIRDIWVRYCNYIAKNTQFDDFGGQLIINYVYPGAESTTVYMYDSTKVEVIGFDKIESGAVAGETTFDVKYGDWTITVNTYVYDRDLEDTVTKIKYLYLTDSVYKLGEDVSLIDFTLQFDISFGETDMHRETVEINIADYIVGGIESIDTTTLGTKSFKLDFLALMEVYDESSDVIAELEELELFYTVIEAVERENDN